MKVLIVGGGGFLGSFLNTMLSIDNDIISTYHNSPGSSNLYNSFKLDITEKQSLSKIFSDFKPDAVIHTAGITSPNEAANFPAKYVYDVNVNATENIAQLCDKYKAKLIYLSTDLVYAGYRSSWLKEDAKLIPISFYAETKLMGEVKIQNTFDDYIILRSALMYGLCVSGSKNFFAQSVSNLQSNIPIKVFTDQYRTPIYASESARIIAFLIKSQAKGIFNLGGAERISRFELFEKVCEITNLNKELLIKTKMSDIPNYPAVEDVSMNTNKLQSLGISILSVEKSLNSIFLKK